MVYYITKISANFSPYLCSPKASSFLYTLIEKPFLLSRLIKCVPAFQYLGFRYFSQQFIVCSFLPPNSDEGSLELQDSRSNIACNLCWVRLSCHSRVDLRKIIKLISPQCKCLFKVVYWCCSPWVTETVSLQCNEYSDDQVRIWLVLKFLVLGLRATSQCFSLSGFTNTHTEK